MAGRLYKELFKNVIEGLEEDIDFNLDQEIRGREKSSQPDTSNDDILDASDDRDMRKLTHEFDDINSDK